MTLEILSDEVLSQELNKGIQDLAAGHLIDLDDLKSELKESIEDNREEVLI
ncbi:hypothetical protein [Oceanispirochaeta sp.]|jgi:hypothetical protein|uniref:hypothetical protein n=1 Tax=Oceanispirochaeta sp. TaxID=2035350 RepID=UPI0026097963|nr:hypothetical protein [Oceanispirochaeta sp.]MDA3958279.1 hypothetical protein [Oceanispirochaeta sp.]